MKARGSVYVLLILLIAANSGCLAPRSDPPAAASVSPVVSSQSSAALEINESQHQGSDPLLFRAASSEEPETSIFSSPQQSNVGLPSELQTLPLNPVFDLLTGNSTSQSSQDAYATLGLLGLTGMTRIMHGVGNGSGGRHTFRNVADFTDDVLQPDDETPRGKLPPFIFGLEWKY